MILHTHFHSTATVNTRLCLIYRSQDTGAVYTTDTSLSYEKTMHGAESCLTDAFYESDTHATVGEYDDFIRPHGRPHAEAYGSTFPCLSMCLSLLSLGLVTCHSKPCWTPSLGAQRAERIIECTGQEGGTVEMLKLQ